MSEGKYESLGLGGQEKLKEQDPDEAQATPPAFDAVAALAERLHEKECQRATGWPYHNCPRRSQHEFEADEALAFARALLPTREEAANFFAHTGRWRGDYERADALLRDLTARLGGKERIGG